jgi:TM2 domain-containing membrane protein YozV
MICPHCKAQIADGLPYCSNCGKPLSGQQPRSNDPNLVYPKNPPLSPYLAVLNILIPGAAQLVYGQVAKGIVTFIAVYGLLAFGIGVILYFVSIVDAYMVGNCLKNGKPVGQWQFFPT